MSYENLASVYDVFMDKINDFMMKSEERLLQEKSEFLSNITIFYIKGFNKTDVFQRFLKILENLSEIEIKNIRKSSDMKDICRNILSII